MREHSKNTDDLPETTLSTIANSLSDNARTLPEAFVAVSNHHLKSVYNGGVASPAPLCRFSIRRLWKPLAAFPQTAPLNDSGNWLFAACPQGWKTGGKISVSGLSETKKGKGRSLSPRFVDKPRHTLPVTLGPDPRVHAAPAAVDGRVKPDHDEGEDGIP